MRIGPSLLLKKDISMRQTLLSIAIVLTGLAASNAWAFADDDARKAILELRQQLAASQEAQMGMISQLEQLRSQNQQLMGDIEELHRKVETMDKRLIEIEPARVELDGKVIMVKPVERRDFDEAVQKFRDRDFKGCIAAMDAFKKAWPSSAYLANVDYWRASSYYALNNFDATAKITANMIRMFPKSPKVADAYLLKASAELSDGKMDAAKASLNQIVKRFPKSDQAKTARERLKQIAAIK